MKDSFLYFGHIVGDRKDAPYNQTDDDEYNIMVYHVDTEISEADASETSCFGNNQKVLLGKHLVSLLTVIANRVRRWGIRRPMKILIVLLARIV